MPPLASKSSIDPAGPGDLGGPGNAGLPPDWEPLGTVLRPHGTRGGLRFRLASPLSEWAAWPTRVAFLAARGRPRPFQLTRWRALPAGEALAEVVVPIAREDLLAYRGAALWCSKSVLPPPGDQQVYLFELLRRPAIDQAGNPLGVIVHAYDHGAGAVLSVLADDGQERLLPMAIVTVLTSAEGGPVRLHLPEALTSQW